jgi:hypothetical protein
MISAVTAATQSRLTDVEAYFEVWKGYALWADDISYVCLWNTETLTQGRRHALQCRRPRPARPRG